MSCALIGNVLLRSAHQRLKRVLHMVKTNRITDAMEAKSHGKIPRKLKVFALSRAGGNDRFSS